MIEQIRTEHEYREFMELIAQSGRGQTVPMDPSESLAYWHGWTAEKAGRGTDTLFYREYRFSSDLEDDRLQDAYAAGMSEYRAIHCANFGTYPKQHWTSRFSKAIARLVNTPRLKAGA
jgi:hypothetical protein